MRIIGWLTERQIGSCLVLILAAPTAKAAATPWRNAAPTRQEQSAPSSRALEASALSGNGKSMGDSAQPDAALPDAPEVAQSQSTTSDGQNGGSQPGQNQQQNSATQPVGTAAAPSETVTGVAASKPAGAAIAPAKQRRVRTFLISIGVIVAAGVAIGAVVGLSHTSPSQPK
jgi:hypothetical protein